MAEEKRSETKQPNTVKQEPNGDIMERKGWDIMEPKRDEVQNEK